MCPVLKKKIFFQMNQSDEISQTVISEADRLGGTENMLKYVEKVYKFLKEINPGVYKVEKYVTGENFELFTAIVKLYIIEIGGVSFLRDDWKEFRKI